MCVRRLFAGFFNDYFSGRSITSSCLPDLPLRSLKWSMSSTECLPSFRRRPLTTRTLLIRALDGRWINVYCDGLIFDRSSEMALLVPMIGVLKKRKSSPAHLCTSFTESSLYVAPHFGLRVISISSPNWFSEIEVFLLMCGNWFPRKWNSGKCCLAIQYYHFDYCQNYSIWSTSPMRVTFSLINGKVLAKSLCCSTKCLASFRAASTSFKFLIASIPRSVKPDCLAP